jgi:hypothetical protein
VLINSRIDMLMLSAFKGAGAAGSLRSSQSSDFSDCFWLGNLE